MFLFNFFLWHLIGRDDAFASSCASEADESMLLSLAKREAPPSIAVVSGCVADLERPDYVKFCRIAEKNFRSYVAYQNRLLHGSRERKNEMTHFYKFFWFDAKEPGAEDRKVVWSKIPALQKALKDPSVQYAFWMDADSLVMNFGKRLESFIPRGDSHVSFSGGVVCFLNAGHMMFKNDAWTKTFLEDVWETFPAPGWYEEQAAMVYILQKHSSKEKAATCRKNVRSLRNSPLGCCNGTGILGVDQRPDMNVFPVAYQSGDFIVHFASLGAHGKYHEMEQFEKKVLQPK